MSAKLAWSANWRWFSLFLLFLCVPALARPGLSAAQINILKGSKAPVFVPSYIPKGYTLVKTSVDERGYQLNYQMAGKPSHGAHKFMVYATNNDFTDELGPYPKEDRWPINHPKLGKATLFFLPEKLRGGPLTLKPMLTVSPGVFYNLEGALSGPEGIRVIESLQAVSF